MFTDEYSFTMTLTEKSSRELVNWLKRQDEEFINGILDGKISFTLASEDGRSVELLPSPMVADAIYKNREEWIPVSERLPELSIHESDPWIGEWNNSEAVLVYSEDMHFESHYLIAEYTDGFSDIFGKTVQYGWTEMVSAEEIKEVLAWRPLPEPYKKATPIPDCAWRPPDADR